MGETLTREGLLKALLEQAQFICELPTGPRVCDIDRLRERGKAYHVVASAHLDGLAAMKAEFKEQWFKRGMHLDDFLALFDKRFPSPTQQAEPHGDDLVLCSHCGQLVSIRHTHGCPLATTPQAEPHREKQNEDVISYSLDGTRHVMPAADAPLTIWSCKIGEVSRARLPRSPDLPMRDAISKAYEEITGKEPDFIFSGWGASLTKNERAVVEDGELDLDDEVATTPPPASPGEDAIWLRSFGTGRFSDIADRLRALAAANDDAVKVVAKCHAERNAAWKEADDLRAANEKLRAWVADCQSGMYVNCVYCGHRYGPGETTPVSMADALKAHIERCDEHPMAALRSAYEDANRRAVRTAERFHAANEWLRTALDNESAIVSRVWRALGISTYQEANGQTIDEIVASLRSANEGLEKDVEHFGKNSVGDMGLASAP